MRMHMRRFTRLTNAFSKKLENHCYAIALHFVYYNFCKIHKTLRVTSAMEAKLTKKANDYKGNCFARRKELITETTAQVFVYTTKCFFQITKLRRLYKKALYPDGQSHVECLIVDCDGIKNERDGLFNKILICINHLL